MSTPPRVDARDEAARLRRAAAEQYAGTAGDATVCTFVCISDTHNKHAAMMPLPDADVLVHAGDITIDGSVEEVESFAKWWHAQPHAQKIIIAGARARKRERERVGVRRCCMWGSCHARAQLTLTLVLAATRRQS
jgi:3',5'-cyclic AMP phosphodiesterase CpdA